MLEIKYDSRKQYRIINDIIDGSEFYLVQIKGWFGWYNASPWYAFGSSEYYTILNRHEYSSSSIVFKENKFKTSEEAEKFANEIAKSKYNWINDQYRIDHRQYVLYLGNLPLK